MRYALMTLVAVIAGLPLWAAGFDQLPPGKWWENPRLVEHIKLSTEQQEAINERVYAHAFTMIDLKAEVERAELTLKERADRSDFDADNVRAAFVDFQKARQILENERFEMLLAVRQVLSAEQWRELHKLRREFERRRPERMEGQLPPGPRHRPEQNRPYRPDGG